MEVYALSGPSGTGKSTNALSFAYEKEIPAIIDDGLLIYRGIKVAGTSAKYERNSITAVKRATFYFERHRREVRQAIQSLRLNKILVIGTSKEMVDRIADRLGLGAVNQYFSITDISSSREIKIAQYLRKTQGTHTIPIAYKQVEQTFLQKLITRGKKIFSPKKEMIGETTIVRPIFHKGVIHISDEVIKKIITIACNQFPQVADCKCTELFFPALPFVRVELTVKYDKQLNLQTLAGLIKQKIAEDFDQLLDLEIDAVYIHFTKMVY